MTRWVVPYLVLAAVVGGLLRLAARPISNYDTYFHLRFGHEFLAGWSLTHPGRPTSFATADWVPTQWLPQIGMAAVEDHLGLAGVAWLSGLMFTGLALLLFAGARRRADPIIAGPIVALAVLGSTSGLSMRPQVISYCLVIVTLMAWQSSQETGRVPWSLVPLTWVWAMCHGMWPLGVVVSLAAATGMALDGRPRDRLCHFAVPGLSFLLAAVLTPVGPGLVGAVLLVNSRSDYFSEWSPPDFTTLQPAVVLVMLSAALLLMSKRLHRSWFELAIIGVAGGFLLYSQRTVPVAACMLALVLADEAQRAVGSRTPARRAEKLGVGVATVAGLAILALVVPVTADRPPSQPGWVEAKLGKLPPGTKVLNGMAFGGYLMWRYPALDFVFSGYGDVYTDAELEETVEIESLKPGWDELVRELRPEYAMLDPKSSLAYTLRTGEAWRVVDQSDEVQLLQPPPGWMDE